jgi:hypothetical protein
MKKNALISLSLALVVSMLSSGCGNKAKEDNVLPVGSTKSQSQSQAKKQEPIINPLTGEATLSPDAEGKRPVSIMISNAKESLPQRGIGSADIVYETLAEYGVTRCMALFADINKVPQVGPVRSVREYFTDFALPYNTIFTHFGGSVTGYEKVKDRKVQNVDGMEFGVKIFTQDNALAKAKGKEHSYFIDTKGILKGVETKKYKLEGDTINAFKFATKEMPQTLGASEAKTATIPFSGYVTSTFNYNQESMKYEKSEFNQKHIDALTKKQIAVDNVIILFAPLTVHMNVLSRFDLSGDNGFYLNKGKVEPITYTKSSYNKQFKFKASNGEELVVAPGKTYICVVPESQKTSVTIG